MKPKLKKGYRWARPDEVISDGWLYLHGKKWVTTRNVGRVYEKHDLELGMFYIVPIKK